MLTLPNYQIGSQIYESANSLVYRGIRKKDNQPVILKMLKEDYPTPAELTRYRQEYEITHDLDLAGIIKVYGIEKYQNTLVIILEDFGGESLKSTFEKRSLSLSKRGISISDFLPLAIQITETLGQIHVANIIHKDINPANIVWNKETNQLKIIDFGIASRLPRENPTLKNPKQLEGTLAYLSPEQTGRINRSMDYRTDLYSLGVTFYELLTGQLPFDTTDAMELVHCHIAKTPSPVCEVNSDIPPIVSDIILKLMAKNAEDRYQSAFGVKADLENLTGLEDLSGLQFELAQNDFSGKLQIPQKLYGRENEINTLLQSFERVSEGATEMMLVAGYSGVGKTALVHEVHKPMTEKRGYFASGKFDQFQKNIPYSALSHAFNEFCRYLLMESAETLANWQTKILDALGNNGQIIIDVIPDLELVIGPQPLVAKVGPTEAQNRFQMFFLNFIKVLSDKEHPFILFIDDLQWVDSASLGLLKSIMLDDEIRQLLIIGAYRDNEVDSSHPFIMVVDELQKANAIINTIYLSNLLVGDINYLLQDSLKCEALLSQPLTDLIYQKTQGNAFFTHQFLLSLYSDALLRFDFEQLKWQWDIEQISTQNITANVVELMANKIGKLPKETSAALQLAACIGNQFDLPILAIIYEQDKSKTLSVLQPAIVEGLIQPLDENYKHADLPEGWCEKSQFKFLHDRIQQAAYALIDDEQKRSIHLQIGRLLLKNTPTNILEEQVFNIIGHFNHSLELLDNQAERLEISQLNLMAGQKAKVATAHGASIKYLQIGMMLLSTDSWQTDYNLTINLYVEGTEAAYLSNDFEKMAYFANIVLDKAEKIIDQVPVFETKLQAYSVQNQHLDGIHAGLTYLHWLGVDLPEEPSQEEVGNWLTQTKKLLDDYSQEQLLAFPVMTEPLKLAAMRILTRMIPLCFLGRPTLLPLISCAGIKLSIEYGNAPDSPVSYVNYGFVFCTPNIADYTFGYQCGRLANNLLQQQGGKQLAPIVLNNHAALIAIWTEPLRNTFPALKESYQVGIEVGDLEFSFYGMMNYLILVYAAGKKLSYVREELEQYSTIFKHVRYIDSLIFSIYQTVLNLMGEANDPCELKGEVYNEEDVLPYMLERNNHVESSVYYCNKISLNYLFGQFKKAQQYIELAETHAYQIAGLHPFIQFCFFAPLVELALTPTFSEEVFKKIEFWQKSLKKCAEHAPMNFQHKYDLVEAEKSRVLGQEWQAAKLYDKAIAGAKDNEYLNEEALAYELAANFYLGRGMEKIAQTYMREAHYRYQQWGALAKVADLEERYPQWLAQKSTPAMPTMLTGTSAATMMASTRTRTNTSQWLDLDSVTKAAQTLAGEIVLSKLLEKMMHTLIENAGAERGLLILDKEKGKSDWVIEAEGTLHVDKVTVLQSLPIENRLPSSIVNYVVRTRESVVLANAMIDGIYTENSYIQQHQLKSVLCSPILHQGQLIGLLYLENNLTEGAFTPARLKIVDMLSSQAAISLENALLYRTLEQKVEQRTAQLATANQEITFLNERLEEENLRMGAELDVAKQIQQMVLPKESELQQIEGLDIAGFMEPADEVGGDYYDVLVHEGRVKIGIGDVTGHGLESGVLMLMVQTAVRTLLDSGVNDATQFLTTLNHTIYNNVQRMGTDKNLTLSLIDYQDKQLRVTGQHEEILLVRQSGQIERIDTFDLGFSVGVIDDIAEMVSQTHIELQPGDGIVLYTDGITEARNLNRELYGIERLCEVVSQSWQQTAQEIQKAVINDVRHFIGEQKVFDDITLLVLKQK